MTNADRIAALERKIKELEAEVAALKARPAEQHYHFHQPWYPVQPQPIVIQPPVSPQPPWYITNGTNVCAGVSAAYGVTMSSTTFYSAPPA